jgi:hypothetical protein
VVGKPLSHTVEVQQVILSNALPRYLAFVDANRNLYMTPLLRTEFKVCMSRKIHFEPSCSLHIL